MGAQDKAAAPASNVNLKPQVKKSSRITAASASKVSYIDLTNDEDDVTFLSSKKKTPATPRKRKMEEEDPLETSAKKKKAVTPGKKKDEEQRLKQFRKQAPQTYLQKLSRAQAQR